MKKIIVSFMIATLTLSSIFASGVKETTEIKQDEPIILEWWSWSPEMKEKNQIIINKYEFEHPNIKIENTLMSASEYWPKLRIRANQGNLPDVFGMSSSALEEWAEGGLLGSLDEYINNDNTKEEIYTNLLDSTKAIAGGEHYYALPFALVTTNLYYNKDMFDVAGLSYPTDDWTWDDFKSAAKALTLDKDSDGIIDQWGFWFYGRYTQIESWVYANDGYLINRDTMKYDPNENAIEALKMLTDLVLIDKVAPPQKEMSAFRQRDIFAHAQAAMSVEGSWNIDNNRMHSDPNMRWGVAKIPLGPSAKVGYIYGWSDSYAMAPNSEYSKEAWDFMKYIAGEGIGMDMYMAGKIPSYKAITESAAFDASSQQPDEMYILKEQASGDMLTSFTKGWSEWRGYGAAEALGLNGIIDGIVNGEMTFDDAMIEAPKDINSVLNRYYE
jgi:multiple sugar transport system substrate-binding protein